jgi:hypothetical protein
LSNSVIQYSNHLAIYIPLCQTHKIVCLCVSVS